MFRNDPPGVKSQEKVDQKRVLPEKKRSGCERKRERERERRGGGGGRPGFCRKKNVQHALWKVDVAFILKTAACLSLFCGVACTSWILPPASASGSHSRVHPRELVHFSYCCESL